MHALNRAVARRRWAAYAFLVILAFIGLGAITYPAKAHLRDDEELIGAGGDVLLSPGDWIGRRFPLARYMDIGPALMEGRWALMFYRSDCSACRTALAEFVGLAYHLSNLDRSTRMALIEVPYDGADSEAPSREGLCQRGRLSVERRWRIHTPTFLVMNEGKVVNVPNQLTGVYRELGVGGGEEEEQGGGNLFPDFRKVRRERFPHGGLQGHSMRPWLPSGPHAQLFLISMCAELLRMFICPVSLRCTVRHEKGGHPGDIRLSGACVNNRCGLYSSGDPLPLSLA